MKLLELIKKGVFECIFIMTYKGEVNISVEMI